MRVPGRRHWTETVALYSVTETSSGRGTGARTRSLIESDVTATVQPVSDAELIRHGITTNAPVYWLRVQGPKLATGYEVLWDGHYYRILNISQGNDIDVQVMMERTRE